MFLLSIINYEYVGYVRELGHHYCIHSSTTSPKELLVHCNASYEKRIRKKGRKKMKEKMGTEFRK